jgi:hypothetical protein
VKTNNELLATPGVKGIVTHIMHAAPRRRSEATFSLNLALVPIRFLPRLIAHLEAKLRLISKINIKAPLEEAL